MHMWPCARPASRRRWPVERGARPRSDGPITTVPRTAARSSPRAQRNAGSRRCSLLAPRSRPCSRWFLECVRGSQRTPEGIGVRRGLRRRQRTHPPLAPRTHGNRRAERRGRVVRRSLVLYEDPSRRSCFRCARRGGMLAALLLAVVALDSGRCSESGSKVNPTAASERIRFLGVPGGSRGFQSVAGFR